MAYGALSVKTTYTIYFWGGISLEVKMTFLIVFEGTPGGGAVAPLLTLKKVSIALSIGVHPLRVYMSD